MRHLWKDVPPSLSPGIYATSLCKRCGLKRRWEKVGDSYKWMYFVDGLYRLRGPVCQEMTMNELNGKTFRWREYNFKLEPNALLRPWWVVEIPDPHRPNGGIMFSFHVGPRIEGGDLPYQAIVSLPSADEGVEPFELAHAVGSTPKLALDTVAAMAETATARLKTMLEVINHNEPG